MVWVRRWVRGSVCVVEGWCGCVRVWVGMGACGWMWVWVVVCVCVYTYIYIYIYIYTYNYKVYSLRGTSPAHVAREGPYAAVTFCCQGMRRESGHWAGEGLGSGGWERGSLLATQCHGCVRAFNGHRPPPASRKAGETQMAQWAYGALSRLALLGVFCISRRRWTGTPCQIRQD